LSPRKEFLYGDGIYSNISIGSDDFRNTRILAPITPNIAVLYALPVERVVEPRIFSVEADDDLHSLVNTTTQIYSKNCLFFRGDPPELSEFFRRGEHLRYENQDPIELLARKIPGVKHYSRRLYQPIGS
jgi:hypothetical protein